MVVRRTKRDPGLSGRPVDPSRALGLRGGERTAVRAQTPVLEDGAAARSTHRLFVWRVRDAWCRVLKKRPRGQADSCACRQRKRPGKSLNPQKSRDRGVRAFECRHAQHRQERQPGKGGDRNRAFGRNAAHGHSSWQTSSAPKLQPVCQQAETDSPTGPASACAPQASWPSDPGVWPTSARCRRSGRGPAGRGRARPLRGPRRRPGERIP